MRFLPCLLLLLCYFASQNITAQKVGNPAQATNVPLSQQIDQMVDASNRYQRFRVVPAEWLAALKVNVQDSLDSRATEISGLEANITKLESTIEGQIQQLAEREATVASLNEEKNGISFFGAIIDKALYNTIVWGLIAALAGAVIFLLGRSRYAVSVSRDLESNNAELVNELEQAKRRRLEVEQDLRRKLQDERNKRNG